MAPERTGIGFHAEPAVKAELRVEHNLFEETHPDDLRYFGLIPEFIRNWERQWAAREIIHIGGDPRVQRDPNYSKYPRIGISGPGPV